eukprot:jgi/Tetstr1/430356/TSEL_020171.t1
MIRASTELGNSRSQLKHLVKGAVGAEEAEQYWRAVVDKQKAVEKELRSLLAKEAKQREEDAILRRKKEKAISRLRAKVRQLYTCPEHADDASGDEVSSKSDYGGEDAAAYRSVRERPSGLVYKLREARNYATIRKNIGRKVDMLDNWLTEIVGDDGSWKEMYTKTVVDSDSDSDSQAADDCGDAGTTKKQRQPPPPQEWEQIEKEEDLVGQPARIVYDDESVVGVKGKEGLLVNSVENNLPCAFFLRDDCYEDVMKSLPTLPQQIDTLLAEELMVDGKKHGVERFIERMAELAHKVLDYTYDCHAAGATVLGDNWFASVKAYLESHPKDKLAGSRMVLRSTVEDVGLMAIGHKPIPRPGMVSQFFARSPRVDNHNQSRQHDLMLEELWLTQDCRFRLHTTMAGIHDTDCWTLAKHHLPRHHPLKESNVVNFDDLMCKSLIYNGLTGEVEPTRRTERVLANITNEPPALMTHGIMHLGKRPGNDNATKQARCTMCRVDDDNVGWTSYKCPDCDIPLCIPSKRRKGVAC